MNRMKSIHDQKESLQAKLDEYTPIEKEKVILMGMADELEKLYVDIGQWRQTIEDADRLEKEHKNWEIDFVNMGYQLPLWDHPLDLKEPCVNVNWEEGRRLAQSVGVRKTSCIFGSRESLKLNSWKISRKIPIRNRAKTSGRTLRKWPRALKESCIRERISIIR